MADLEREARDLFPLTVTFGKHNLCHIESSDESPAGPGVTVCSVPRKWQGLAIAMVEAVNANERNRLDFASAMKVLSDLDAAERAR